MSQSVIYHCDVCGYMKNTDTGWWAVEVNHTMFLVTPWDGFLFTKTTKHLCGAECLHKALDKFLTKGDFDGQRDTQSV